MWGKHRKRQARVEITFKHMGNFDLAMSKEVIEILPGQKFQTGIATDKLWEGDTLIKEWDWKAGYTKVYEYFYV